MASQSFRWRLPRILFRYDAIPLPAIAIEGSGPTHYRLHFRLQFRFDCRYTRSFMGVYAYSFTGFRFWYWPKSRRVVSV
jgi:hypothetical protein